MQCTVGAVCIWHIISIYRAYCHNELQTSPRKLVWQAEGFQPTLPGWNYHLHLYWSNSGTTEYNLAISYHVHHCKSNLPCIQHPATIQIQVWRLSKRSQNADSVSILNSVVKFFILFCTKLLKWFNYFSYDYFIYIMMF